MEGSEPEHPTWPLFSTGDVVGCGVEWRDGEKGKGKIFWTHNGVRLGTLCTMLIPGSEWANHVWNIDPGVEFESRRLYPAVGLRAKGARVQANFGKEKFRYEVAGVSANSA